MFIPYAHYWSTPFARWQGSLAQLHGLELAARCTGQWMETRGLVPEQIDYAAYGHTVIQHRIFYGTPWFTGLAGLGHLPGPTVSQACATGARLVATAMGAAAAEGAETVLIASGDRLSNGPHVYYPAPSGPGGTGRGEDWVMDNFALDPHAGGAMIQTAENVAAREGIDTAEQHDVVLHRRAQYDDALGDFQARYMLPVQVTDARFRKVTGRLDADEGIEPADPEKLARLKPVLSGGTVTFAGQTHPADGNAGMILCARAERAAELAPDGPRIEVLGTAQARAEKGFMPAAPIKASATLLNRLGLTITDIDAIKSHNPFAVNDIAFARAFGIDWRDMNNFGSSLIWGHPQGPTGLRAMIELIEELAARGGGTGLFQGCAAGDSAMAVVIRVG